jgi:hypothetical protein
MRAGSVRQLLGAFATFAVMLVQGVYAGLFRRHWPAAILAFYPAVLIITTLVLMAASVALMPGWFTSAGLPAWAGAVAGIAVAVGLWHLSAQADQRTYAWYLAADARSAHRLASGRDAEMERRLDHFAREVLAVHDAAGPGDEIVIAGHSSGSFVAVHVMGRVLTWRPDFGAGLAQPPILLTMGSVWALAADFKPSTGYRRGLALLGPARHVDWVEVFAPQDVIGSGRCDPVAEVMGGADLPGKRNPRLCSARLGDSLAPERLERLRWRFFQLHFQFLAATDRPGYFDFHEVLAGPSARWALGLGGEIADASLVGSGGG